MSDLNIYEGYRMTQTLMHGITTDNQYKYLTFESVITREGNIQSSFHVYVDSHSLSDYPNLKEAFKHFNDL